MWHRMVSVLCSRNSLSPSAKMKWGPMPLPISDAAPDGLCTCNQASNQAESVNRIIPKRFGSSSSSMDVRCNAHGFWKATDQDYFMQHTATTLHGYNAAPSSVRLWTGRKFNG